jgi:hypothetical protein
MSGQVEVRLHGVRAGHIGSDRIVMPTAMADDLERWFNDPSRADSPAYVTPADGGAELVLNRSDYYEFSRRAAR